MIFVPMDMRYVTVVKGNGKEGATTFYNLKRYDANEHWRAAKLVGYEVVTAEEGLSFINEINKEFGMAAFHNILPRIGKKSDSGKSKALVLKGRLDEIILAIEDDVQGLKNANRSNTADLLKVHQIELEKLRGGYE